MIRLHNPNTQFVKLCVQSNVHGVPEVKNKKKSNVHGVPEIKNKKKDGSFYWVYTYVFPVKECLTDERRYLTISFDISASKELQEKFTSQEKMSSLGTMAAGIAHEVNNPLTVIKMKAEQLKELAEDEVVDKKMVSEIADAC